MTERISPVPSPRLARHEASRCDRTKDGLVQMCKV